MDPANPYPYLPPHASLADEHAKQGMVLVATRGQQRILIAGTKIALAKKRS